MNQETKHPFDYSGASIWTTDAKLKMINIGKKNGTTRREQLKHNEVQGLHLLQSKRNKK
jgi:hypothetical protein